MPNGKRDPEEFVENEDLTLREMLKISTPEEAGGFEKLGAMFGFPASLGLTRTEGEIQAAEEARANIQAAEPIIRIAEQMNLSDPVQQLLAQEIMKGSTAGARATLGLGRTIAEQQEEQKQQEFVQSQVGQLSKVGRVQAKTFEALGQRGQIATLLNEELRNPTKPLGIASLIGTSIPPNLDKNQFAIKLSDFIPGKDAKKRAKDAKKATNQFWNRFVIEPSIVDKASKVGKEVANFFGADYKVSVPELLIRVRHPASGEIRPIKMSNLQHALAKGFIIVGKE